MTPGVFFYMPNCGCCRVFSSFPTVGSLPMMLRWEQVSTLPRSPAVESFYVSWIWRKCRKTFADSKGNLCERCMKRGVIEPGSKDRPLEVHHKIPLTADNVTDPEITLNWANLELLCKTCHDQERERKGGKRWKIVPDGRVLL